MLLSSKVVAEQAPGSKSREANDLLAATFARLSYSDNPRNC